jgi:hypothetical protein
MTVRVPVSSIFARWHDAQRVDQVDMTVEQTRHVQTDAATLNNHFGSGVLPSSPIQNVLFDSDDLTGEQAALLAAHDFDGTGMQAHQQPSDTNLGNQLEVELTDSTVFGRLSTKVLIMGLDFENTPQMDRLYFHRNEKQVTSRHYTRILGIFFYDFKGNNNCSRNMGGRITIKEAASYQLSRDSIMVAQDLQPDLFFRDFKTSNAQLGPNPTVTLYQTLQQGIGSEYSVDAFQITTTANRQLALNAGDVTNKIGQKFQARTSNIQKVTLLLGAGRNDAVAVENRYDWSGDLVISIYELQTAVACPTQLVPELAIEFDPSPEPLAQLSFSQAELYDLGYVLTDVLQPVDFIFSNTQLGSTTNSVIVPDRYYAVTMNRAGAAGTGMILTATGASRIEDARLTLFSGSWVDVPEEDLWFQIWQDAAKIADGSAYDEGKGITVEKTALNELGATVDYALDAQEFANTGENVLNTGVVEAIVQESLEEQDERTGNQVNSRQQYVPSFSFVTSADLASLRETSEPMVVGCAQDTNPKDNVILDNIQYLPGLVKDDTFTVVNPDPDLLSVNLIGSKLIPNNDCAAKDYRIFRVTYCVDGYGDVNGDGVIDADDIARATALLGESLDGYATQQKILDGYITTLELLRADVDGDGYITSNDVNMITQFVARNRQAFPVGTSFDHLELQVQYSIGRYDGYFDCDGYIRLDGYEGRNIVSPEALDPWELLYDGYNVPPDMDAADPGVWRTTPFVPVPYRILPQPFWQDYLLAFSSDARLVPATFSYSVGTTVPSCTASSTFSCTDRADVAQSCDPGRNDFMVPDNLIMRQGQILQPDGSHYPVDMEVNHIIINLPQVPFEESSINVFEKLILDNGDGFTSAGYPAMRFADCTTVQSDALIKNQIRFGVAIQAFVPNLDGYTEEDGYGVIVDDVIGVYMDHSTGIVTLTIKDLSADPIYLTLVTKLEVTVFLKKAGWINQPLVIDQDQVEGLFST